MPEKMQKIFPKGNRPVITVNEEPFSTPWDRLQFPPLLLCPPLQLLCGGKDGIAAHAPAQRLAAVLSQCGEISEAGIAIEGMVRHWQERKILLPYSDRITRRRNFIPGNSMQ